MNYEKYKLKARYDFRAYKNFEELVSSIAKEKGITKTKARKMAYSRIPLESKYQGEILKALRQEFPRGRWRKVAQGFGSVSGEPDVDGVLDGKFIAIEVKRPLVGEESELQKKAVRQIRQAGGCAMFASYPEEVLAAVAAYFRNEPYWYELSGCCQAVAEGPEECLE